MFLGARRTSDKTPIAVIQVAYVHGIDARRRRSGQGSRLAGISKSQVARLCEEIDERVKAFLSRLIEGSWPYVWIDAPS
jgi:putative transposase